MEITESIVWYDLILHQKENFATHKKKTLNEFPSLLSQELKILYATQSIVTLFF